MARNTGTFNFSANFEVKVEGFLDARQGVDSYADLLLFTADNYIKTGFTVSVYDLDPAKRGIYMCLDKSDLSNPLSWLKIGSISLTESVTSGSTDAVTSGAVWSYLDTNYYTQTELDALLHDKEPVINLGTDLQYWRGDKTWQTLNTTVVPEGINLYYTNDRADARITLQKGTALGLAPLDNGAKISETYLPDSILGQVRYQGTYNAATGTPALPDATTVKGHYYIITADGSVNSIDFKVGDWVISNGVEWQKVDNSDSVTTVFGRLGNVVANTGDYTTAQVTEDASYLYYTDARSRAAISVSGSLSYNSSTGVISYTQPDYSTTYLGINATAVNSTAWGGNTLQGEATANPNYLLGAGAGGNAYYYTAAIVKSFLGLGTAAYLNASVSETADTIAKRDGWGGLFASYFNMGLMGVDNATIAQIATTGSDGTLRRSSASAVRIFLGMPTGGDTLQSVTDRGASTTKGINVGAFDQNITSSFSNNATTGSTTLTVFKNRSSSLSGEKVFDVQSYSDGVGVESRFAVLSNGNVGIGTTSPNYRLHIHSTESENYFQITTGLTGNASGQGLWMGLDGSSNVVFRENSGTGYFFQTGGSNTRMFIGHSGNVGIGTTNPEAKVHALGQQAFRADYNEDHTIIASYNGAVRRWQIDTLSSGFNVYMQGSSTYAFNVTSGGNVLVGTGTGISGGGALQVNGNVNINGVFQINGVTIGGGGGSGITGSGTTGYIPKYSSSTSIGNSLMTDVGSAIRFQSGSNGYIQISAGPNTSQTGYLEYFQSGGGRIGYIGYNNTDMYYSAEGGNEAGHIFGTAGSERMRITSGGDVGIGTTSISSKLHVAGTFRNALASTAGGQTLISAINGVSNGYLINVDTSNNITHTWHTGANAASLHITSGGNVLIGTITDSGYKLRVNGTGYFDGYVTTAAGAGTSDMRYKIVEDMKLDLTLLDNIDSFQFRWNDKMNIKESRSHWGYSAQEIMTKLCPDLVFTDNSEHYHLNQVELLTLEVKRLKQRVKELEERIAA